MSIKCELTDFDLAPYLDLEVKATSVQGLRCDDCGWETLGGEEINSALHRVAGILLRQEERLETDRVR